MTTYTYTQTFTRAHARKLAGRVASDLRQCRLLYEEPSEAFLDDYLTEMEELLTGGYVSQYQFGFQRNGQTVWSLRYTVGPDGDLTSAGAAGGVPARHNVSGADYFNFLTFSPSWLQLSPADRKAIEEMLPFTRKPGFLPGTANGSWTADRTYTAGGIAVQRSVFKTAS
ncbi:MAG: hypothetical protein QG597_753 [Actinomycetota bacterium]|nr:hypothetical protein [Actinomycetota bacterium]